jgi:hypothetical protein
MSKLILLLLTLLLTAGLALSAAAGTLYRYTTEDGGIAFTDDPERVPARYRAQAQAVETRGLERYARFTPADAAARARHDEGLAERLAWLREFNAAAELPAAQEPGAHPLPETIVQVNRDTSVRIPTAQLADDGPIVVEEVRVKRPGLFVTTHNTVVRQGDRILLVVRPSQQTQAGPNDFIDERDLLR